MRSSGRRRTSGPLRDARRASSTTSTSTLTCTASWTRRSAASLAALGDPGDPRSLRSRTVIVRDLRPRRDGALARRPAAEDVQRLRGDDPRAARRLEPACCSREPARERRARLARRRRPDAAGRWRGAPARTARFDGRDLGAGPRPQRAPGRTRARCEAAASTSAACSSVQPRRTRVRDAVALHLRRPPGGDGVPGHVPGSRTGSAASAATRWKYAVYLDPTGGVAPEYELYDLEPTPTSRATSSTGAVARCMPPPTPRSARRRGSASTR